MIAGTVFPKMKKKKKRICAIKGKGLKTVLVSAVFRLGWLG